MIIADITLFHAARKNESNISYLTCLTNDLEARMITQMPHLNFYQIQS